MSDGLFLKTKDSVNLGVQYIIIMGILGDFLHALADRFFSAGYIEVILEFVFLLLLLINALPRILRSVTANHILVALCISFVYISSVIVTTDIELHKLVITYFFRYGFIPLLFAISIRDIEDMYTRLVAASYIIVVVAFLGMFVFHTAVTSSESYSQEFGYILLVPMSFFFCRWIREKRLRDITLVILSLVLMLSSGSRGPLFCAIICIILACFLLQEVRTTKDLFVIVFLVVSLLCVFIWYRPILLAISTSMEQFGVSTRVFNKLLAGDISNDNSRTDLRNFAISYIKNHWLFGTGFANDRILIYANVWFSKTQNVYGSYCHNFFLELMMQFGLIPGLILAIAFCKKIVSGFNKKVMSIKTIQISIVFFTSFFLILLLSRSYITTKWFYLYAGFIGALPKIVKYNSGKYK